MINIYAPVCLQVSAKLLAPIIPHTSEHVWSALLKKPGSVVNSGFPVGEEPDFVMHVSPGAWERSKSSFPSSWILFLL
jgi:valyl-tRNA synthetase